MSQPNENPSWIVRMMVEQPGTVMALAILPFLLLIVGVGYYIDGRFEDLEEQLSFVPPKSYEAPVLEKYKTDKTPDQFTVRQRVYVPVYSHVYYQEGSPYPLETTLSLRNVDPERNLYITRIDYYNTEGSRIRSLLKEPIELDPLETIEFLVERKDSSGVVFEDLNGNSFYDIGEGRSGVRVDVEGSLFYAISSDSGGYSVPVDGSGTYDVSFTSSSYATFDTTVNSDRGENVKVDYLVSSVIYDPADFDTDGDVDGADLAIWETNYGVNALADANDDNRSDGLDLLIWQQNYTGSLLTSATAVVPEPATLSLALFSIVGLGGRHRGR